MKRLLVLMLGVLVSTGCAIAYDTIPAFTAHAEYARQIEVDKSLAETYSIITNYQDVKGYGEFMKCELEESMGQCSLKGSRLGGNRGYLYYVEMKPLSPDSTLVSFFGADSPGDAYKYLMENSIQKLNSNTEAEEAAEDSVGENL